MKTFKPSFTLAGVLVGAMLLLGSCGDDDEDSTVDLPDNIVEFEEITLSSEAEVQEPAVVSDGTGTMEASYNKDTKILSYTINWTLGDEADETIGMHLHGPASKTENAAVVIGIPLPGSSGGYNDPTGNSGKVPDKTRALTAQEETQLLSGQWYLNIHSTTYPAGELRGQVE